MNWALRKRKIAHPRGILLRASLGDYASVETTITVFQRKGPDMKTLSQLAVVLAILVDHSCPVLNRGVLVIEPQLPAVWEVEKKSLIHGADGQPSGLTLY